MCVFHQENLQTSLGNIINDEQEAVWKKKVTPKRTEDGNFLISEVYTKICEVCKTYFTEEIYLYNIAYYSFCH